MERKYDPVGDREKPLGDLLAIPLNKKNLQKKRKRIQNKQSQSINGVLLTL